MTDTAFRLLWSDEFDAPSGTPPDPRFWQHELGGGGWGNGELQTYTSHRENAFHDGAGNLVIRAQRSGNGVTSARIITKGRVEHCFGRIECRARPPSGPGLWSAFWSLGSDIDGTPWPACGEIDILEHLGADPTRVLGTVHCPGHSREHGVSGDSRAPVSLADDFHVFAVDWTPDDISWSLDHVVYHRVEREALGTAWVFDHPFYLLLNLAVGGWLGGQPDPATRFPADFLVDYIRWYSP